MNEWKASAVLLKEILSIAISHSHSEFDFKSSRDITSAFVKQRAIQKNVICAALIPQLRGKLKQPVLAYPSLDDARQDMDVAYMDSWQDIVRLLLSI
ncbi:hypothetical protein Y032_0153g2942 [Ancylostoma ceylanicum]|nr:hypothetical protein Y032_0153g2942 [Ancylostoma ceylanicum]